MYRLVTLSEEVAGRLYVGSMPGRYEVFEHPRRAIVDHRITRVICLVPADELRDKSPLYALAIDEARMPWTHESFPIEDLEAPADREAFPATARRAARRLRAGETLPVHCAAGIGRTGTCVRLALGLTPAAARAAMRAVGSAPETVARDDVIRWAAGLPRRTGARS